MVDNKLSKKDNALQAIKFALFSVSAGVIQIVSFTLLNELVPDVQGYNAVTRWFFESEYGAYYLVALILSILWNFTVNRKFTFKSATNIPVAMLKVFGFYCVFTPVSTILGEIITPKIHLELGPYVFGAFELGPIELGGYIVLGVTMMINMISEFLFCRFVVYKNSMNTNESAKKGK